MTHINEPSILWYDFETWGANPQRDQPCQFAAIRTDYDLNEIGTPLNWYCQIPNDCLPHPQACLITGITPQQSLRDGLLGYEFANKVLSAMSEPNTCSAGYNSIRFDDEVTRFMAYRNFHDPYAREWQNGNSRWDIIDLVRAAFALRPDGINWVYKDDGTPSFKLEQLSVANNVIHQDAHDALSDVRATIGLAKVIKNAQPKLYDYIFSLRFKNNVKQQIDCFNLKPLVHISSRFPADQGCCSWIVPVAPHPTNSNATICINLALPPDPLFDLSPAEIRQYLYTKTENLPPQVGRIPLKLLYSNKAPVIAPAKTLDPDNAERLGINREDCLKNLNAIKQYPGLQQKLLSVFEEESKHVTQSADFSLYSGGFFNQSDKSLIEQVRHSEKDNLTLFSDKFTDPRLEELLFYYRGRNFPDTFTDDELSKWQQHRQQRFTDDSAGGTILIKQYLEEIEILINQFQQNSDKLRILKDLYRYAEQL